MNQKNVQQSSFGERLATVRSAVGSDSALSQAKAEINFNPNAWKKMGLAMWNRGGGGVTN